MNGYWAFEGFEKELLLEVQTYDPTATQSGRLVLSEKTVSHPIWAQLILENCTKFNFESISQAANYLKSLGKRWASSHLSNFRRAELIQEQVFKYKNKPLNFLGPTPEHDWSFWCLLSEKELLACPKTGSAFPCGEVIFNEDKKNSPSRAYLKLWEVFTVHKIKPNAGEKVIDLGSCPGGWTWVLQNIGCHVVSVDKAPLDPRVAQLPRVEYLCKDAFKLKPSEIGPVDWLFSDLICYPEKLYELVETWEQSGLVKNFVCTIKFQGQTDFATVQKFANKKNSQIVHLSHNKHEVTWIQKLV